MNTTREIAGQIRYFQSLAWRGRQVLLPADFVIQFRSEEGAGVACLADFVRDNPLDAEDLITLALQAQRAGKCFIGGGGAAPLYRAWCLRATGRYTLHHPGTGDVLATAKDEDEALERWTALAGEVAVVLGPGGALAAIDPMAGVPDCDEDDARAFAEMRARWDAALSALALDRYLCALLDGDEAGALAIHAAADPETRTLIDQADHGAACSRSSDPRAPRA